MKIHFVCNRTLLHILWKCLHLSEKMSFTVAWISLFAYIRFEASASFPSIEIKLPIIIKVNILCVCAFPLLLKKNSQYHNVCFAQIKICKSKDLSPFGDVRFSISKSCKTKNIYITLFHCLLPYNGSHHTAMFIWYTYFGTDKWKEKLESLTILTGKNLCFTKFSTKTHWITRLAASDVLHMFTQLIKFF